MRDFHRHLDLGSRVIIVTTLVLFAAALYVKGFGHDLLLEAGVFLISVKLIVITYKNSEVTSDLTDRLGRIESTLTRVEDVLAPGRPSEPTDTIAAGGRGSSIR